MLGTFTKVESKVYVQGLAELKIKLETFARSLDLQYDILGYRRWPYSSHPTEQLTGGKNWKSSIFMYSFPQMPTNFPSKDCVQYCRIN